MSKICYYTLRVWQSSYENAYNSYSVFTSGVACSASVSGNSRRHTENGSRGPNCCGCISFTELCFFARTANKKGLLNQRLPKILTPKHTFFYQHKFLRASQATGTGKGVVCERTGERGGQVCICPGGLPAILDQVLLVRICTVTAACILLANILLHFHTY